MLFENIDMIYGNPERPSGIIPVMFKRINFRECMNFYKAIVEISAKRTDTELFLFPQVMQYLASNLTVLAIKSRDFYEISHSVQNLACIVLEKPRLSSFTIKHRFAVLVLLYRGLFFDNYTSYFEEEGERLLSTAKRIYGDNPDVGDGLFNIIYIYFRDCILVLTEVSATLSELQTLKVRHKMTLKEKIEEKLEKVLHDISLELQPQTKDIDLVGVTEDGVVKIRLLGHCTLEEAQKALQKKIPAIKKVMAI